MHHLGRNVEHIPGMYPKLGLVLLQICNRICCGQLHVRHFAASIQDLQGPCGWQLLCTACAPVPCRIVGPGLKCSMQVRTQSSPFTVKCCSPGAAARMLTATNSSGVHDAMYEPSRLLLEAAFAF